MRHCCSVGIKSSGRALLGRQWLRPTRKWIHGERRQFTNHSRREPRDLFVHPNLSRKAARLCHCSRIPNTVLLGRQQLRSGRLRSGNLRQPQLSSGIMGADDDLPNYLSGRYPIEKINEFYQKGCQEKSSPSTGGREDFVSRSSPLHCKSASRLRERFCF